MSDADIVALNEILTGVKSILELLRKKEDHLKISIEQWRWDIPTVYAVWTEYDGINRNITILVTPDTPPYGLAIEINAWLDEDGGRLRTRHWEHTETRRIKGIPESEELWEIIHSAYDQVSHWDRKALKRETTIQMLASPIANPIAFSDIKQSHGDPTITSVDVRDLIRKLSTEIKQRAKEENRTLKINTELPISLPKIETDNDRIELVIRSIVDNAYKFTPEGGEIIVSATPEKGYVLISVKDTGPGIPPEELSHIFDRFFRGTDLTGREGRGMGLALAIARVIVDSLHGSIQATSEGVSGKGTTINIRLPITQDVIRH